MYLFKASSVTTVQPTTASRSLPDQSEYIVMSCFLIITILVLLEVLKGTTYIIISRTLFLWKHSGTPLIRTLGDMTWGVFHLAKTIRNCHGKVHLVKNLFHLTQVPFIYAPVTKQDGGTDIALNSLEVVIPCKSSWMEPAFSTETFQRENRTTFSNFHLFPGTFQCNARKTRV